MPSTIGEAFIAIRADTDNFGAQAEAGVKPVIAKIAGLIGGAFAFSKIAQGLGDAIGAGSDLNETISKTQAVFGGSSGAALAFGDNAATALREPKQAALEQLSTLGNLFTSLGLGRDKALDMGKGMVSLAADLGSFNNVPTDEALEAIRSGLVGETEPLRRFGVNMNEATLQAKALELGISDGTAALTPAQKAQAAYALIMDQTKNAQGDAARTAGEAAGQQKILAARFEDIKAKIGTALLPVYSKLLEIGGKVVSWLTEHKEVAAGLAVVVGGVLTAAFVGWAASLWTTVAPLVIIAAPILAIAAAIAVVIAAAVLVWTKWDEIWNLIKDHPAIAIIVSILFAPVAAFILIVGGLKTLYENWDSIWKTIQRVSEDVWRGGIKPVFDAIVDFVNDVIIPVVLFLRDVWVDVVWPAIQTAIEVAGFVINVWLGMIRTAIDIVSVAIGFLHDVWTFLWPIISTAVDVAGKIINGILATIRTGVDAVSVAAGFLKGVWDFVWNGLHEALDSARDAARPILNWFHDRLDDLAGLLGTIADAWHDLTGSFSGGLPSVDDKGRPIPGHAMGGRVLPGQPSWVGEGGPELFWPDTSGTIIPHGQSMAMAGAGDGSPGGLFAGATVQFYDNPIPQLDYWALTRAGGELMTALIDGNTGATEASDLLDSLDGPSEPQEAGASDIAA